jgi:hypothetical protein
VLPFSGWLFRQQIETNEEYFLSLKNIALKIQVSQNPPAVRRAKPAHLNVTRNSNAARKNNKKKKKKKKKRTY